MSKYIKLLIFALIANFGIKAIYSMDLANQKESKRKEISSKRKTAEESVLPRHIVKWFKAHNENYLSKEEIIKIINNNPLQKEYSAIKHLKSTELATKIKSTTNFPIEIIKIINDYNIDFDFILKIYNYINNRYKMHFSEMCCRYNIENSTFFDLVRFYKEGSRDRFITDMFNCHTILKYQNCFNKLSNQRILILYNFFKKYNFETRKDYYNFKEDLYCRSDLSYDAFSRPKCFIIFALLATVVYYAFKNIDFNSQTGQNILMSVYSLTSLILLTMCGDCCIKSIENNPRIFQFCVVALILGYITYDTYFGGPHYINSKDLQDNI